MTDLNQNDNKLFYSIKEVSELLDLKETVLRFWEKEFPQIKPQKGSRGIRKYTKDDIEIIRTIRDLVKGRGLKISAAREVLKKIKKEWLNRLRLYNDLKL